MPEDGDTDLFFQADIVPVAGADILEIHSNCGNVAMLLEEAASAAGIPFMPQ